MNKILRHKLYTFIILAFLGMTSNTSIANSIPPSILKKHLDNISFEENCGQLHDAVYYHGKSTQAAYYFKQNGVRIQVENSEKEKGLVWDMNFKNANPNVKIIGKELRKNRTNYIFNKSQYSNLSNYSEVWYENIYNNIDLRFYSKGDGTIEYDFILKQGACAEDIAIQFDGIDDFYTNREGQLVLKTSLGELKKSAPYTYQVINNQEVEVKSFYKKIDNEIQFQLANYDDNETLVIDPTTLLMSTYLGGTNPVSSLSGMVVQSDGIYIGGGISIRLSQVGLTYPTTSGTYQVSPYFADDSSIGFVSKLSLDGKELLFSTYFYGEEVEGDIRILDVKVDGTGIYLAGSADNVPTTSGVIQPVLPNAPFDNAGFITKMNLDGTDLIYSTYLPGQGTSGISTIKVINQKAYIGGSTEANNFPTTTGAFNETSNGNCGFVAILNEDASSFDYATYIEDNTNSVNFSSSVSEIEVDATGNVYAIGKSSTKDFPLTADALQTSFPTMFSQVYLFKLSPLGNGNADLIFSTYVGGNSNATTLDLKLHGNDLYGMIDVFLPVHDARWAPSENAYRTSIAENAANGKDNFLFKFTANDMQLVETTYLDIEEYRTNGIEIADDCGDLYILGYDSDNLASSQINSFQNSNNGVNDFYLIRMNPDLSDIYSSTYLGGSNTDGGSSRILQYHDGAMYFGGTSESTDFPTTPDVYQDELIGTRNFVIGAFSTLRVEAGNAVIICPDDNPTMPGMVCGGDNNYNYSWDPVLGLSDPTIEQPTLDANQLPIGETLYTLYVTDGNGAVDFDTVRVTVLDNNVIAGAGEDRYLCTGDEAQIGSHNYDLASVTYSWSPSTDLDNPNIGNPIASPSISTTYTLTYTHCDGIITTDQVFVGVDVNPATVIDVGTDPEPCIGGSMTLGTPALENFAYSWEPADGMDDPTKAQPFIGFVFKEETYTLTLTNICTGAEATQSLDVTLNSDGANAGEDAISCPDVDFVIGNTPNPNYTSYQWAFVDGGISGTITNSTSPNPTVNISTAGSHEITLTTMSAACGTSVDTMIAIIIDDNPIPNAGPDQDVCVDYPNSLTTYPAVKIGTPGDEAFTYAWSPTSGLDDPTLAEPTATVTSTTTYTLTVTGICTGNMATDDITLTVPTTIPLAEAYEDDGINDGQDTILICEQPWGGDYIGMDGRVGVVYSWYPETRLFDYLEYYDGLKSPSVLAKPFVNTTYYLTALDTCSGFSSMDTIYVIVDGTVCTPPDPNDPASAPIADAGDEEVILCEGESIQIGTPENPNPALTYEWFPTTDLDNPNIAQPTVQTPTNDRSYTLTVTNTNSGIKSRDIITVRVRPAPLASAGNSPLTFDCGANISNVQLGPANGATQFENDDWDITWTPTIGLDDPKALRPILNGPDVSDAYSVTVVDKVTGCTSTAFMTIQYNEGFADAGDDKVICPGNSVQIGTPGESGSFNFPIFIGYTYEWSPSESLNQFNAAQPIASPTETTEYFLKVTKQTSNFSTGASEVCQQSSTVIVTVTETITEVANAGADHRGLCPTDADVSIGANTDESPNATYSWSPSAGLSNANIPNPIVDISTLASGENTFTLSVTDVTSGCISTDDVVIEINATDPATASVDPTATGCEGEKVDITGVTYPADYIITWTSTDDPNLDFFGPVDSDSPVAFVQSTAMTYTLNVTDACGGSAATADVTVSSVAAPSIDAMGTYGIVCPGGPLALNGVSTTGASTFSWEPAGAVDDATIEQPNFIGTESTILKLTVGNGGCEVSELLSIEVDIPDADAGTDVTTCAGTPVTIGTIGDVVNYDYTWTIVAGPGPLPATTNTPQIDVDPTATTEYQVSVVHKTTGCPAVLDSVIVTIPAGTPTADAGTDVTICPDDAPVAIGSAGVEGIEYEWTPLAGLTNGTIANPKASPAATTIYTVRATNICNGLFSEDQVTITVNPVPNAVAGQDIEGCEGETFTLGGADEGHTYSWSPTVYLDDPNVANPMITLPDNNSNASTFINYTLSVDDGNGCIATDEVTVTIHPIPVLNYNDVVVCNGSGGTVLGDANSISGYNGNYGVLWSPNNGLSSTTVANPTANPKGDITYTVAVYTADGCFVSQRVKVFVEDYTVEPVASGGCESGNGYLSANQLNNATYSWTGPNGFSSSTRINNLTNLTAADFGTYTLTVTSSNACVYTESVEMVDFCNASANCDLAIDNFTVSNCIYNDAEQKSEAIIDVTVSWGAGSPTGERLFVLAGQDTAIVDVPNLTSPQTVQVTVPADALEAGLAAQFETTTSCLATTTYTAPAPCNCTLSASAFADNCTDNGNNNFTATWNLNITVNEVPDNQVSYQRNSEAIQSYTLTGDTGTIQIPNIPADGGTYDTLRIYLTNDVSCGDTLILKRPSPCPTPVAGANEPGAVCTNLGATDIGGTVWEDWDYDGSMNQSDTMGVQGVQVNLYDDCGNVSQTTYTDNNGNYLFSSLDAGTTYRVEFVLPESVSCWAKPTQAGVDNGTTVQFVQSGSCASLGLASPTDYCQDNPYLSITCFTNGDPLAAGTAANQDAIVSFFYNDQTDNSTPVPPSLRHDAVTDEVGAVWGAAFNASTQQLFTAAFLKRHVGWGPQGIGGIYITDYSSATPTNSNFIDLAALGVNLLSSGAPTALLTNGALGRNLPTNKENPSHDPIAFDYVGKVGMGAVQFSEDGNTLFVINLAEQNMVKIDMSDYFLNGTLPTAAQISTLTIPLPTCSNGVARPMALKQYRGKLYVGVTCTGENGGTSADINIAVLAYDIANDNWTTAVDTYIMDYIKGPVDENHPSECNTWSTWTTDDSAYTDLEPAASEIRSCRPAPSLSGIEFDESGNMILGIMDISGHQWSYLNYDKTSTSDQFDWRIGGSILKAADCSNTGVWTIENNGGLCGSAGSANQQNGEGPGGGEFFYEDNMGGNFTVHREVSMGTMMIKKGTNQVVMTAMDPIGIFSGGLMFLNNVNGATDKRSRVYSTGFLNNNGTSGKANGLGMAATICDPAPIEIGNYVWLDDDEDGIQDACEAPLEGIIISLYDDNCNIVALDTTDVFGQYYFNDDKLKAYTPAPNDTILNAHSTYYVVITGTMNGGWNTTASELSLNGTDYELTISNQGENDAIDSDATVGTACVAITDHPFVPINTGDAGCVDHSFDIGFAPKTCPSEICLPVKTVIKRGIGTD